MWLFRRISDPKKLQDLDDRLSKAERELSKLQWEWNDVYDKLRRTMGRVVKAAQRERLPDVPEMAEGNGTDSSVPSSGMTARAAQVQAQILARRNRSAQ